MTVWFSHMQMDESASHLVTGESWQKLVPPKKDSNGVQYSCTDCSLNLHAFTERHDPTDQYSAASATGMVIAVGNVGRELTPYTDGSTFLSRDAGTTWEEIMPDAFMFEFAASGTVFILVNDETPTDTVR
jgi:hypothetical protein